MSPTSATYTAAGVTSNKIHAVLFGFSLVPDTTGTGTAPVTVPANAAIASVDLDVGGTVDTTAPTDMADEEEAAAPYGGLIIPKSPIAGPLPSTIPPESIPRAIAVQAWVPYSDPDGSYSGDVGELQISTSSNYIGVYDSSGNRVTTKNVPAGGLGPETFQVVVSKDSAVGHVTADFTWTAPNSSGTAVDRVRIVPVDVDLDINTHNHPKSSGITVVSGLGDIDDADDPRELGTGGYLWVNDDNDNSSPGDSTIDLDDSSNYSDNDLEPLKYEISNAVWSAGLQVEVQVNATDRVRIWQDNKRHELTPGTYASLVALDFNQDGVLYLEGLKPGEVQITFTVRAAPSAPSIVLDQITATVFAPHLVNWYSSGDTVIDDGSSDNPPPGQVRTGARIFPDKLSASDNAVRDQPRVVASVTPSPPDHSWELPLYVKVFDVDHYHTDTDFDPNGAHEPNDNQSPYTAYTEEGPADDRTTTNGTGNGPHIGLAVLEGSVERVIANSTSDVEWADLVKYEAQSYRADAVLHLLHHTPCNNWRIAVGCGDALSQAVQLDADAGTGQGTSIEYINGTPLNLPNSPRTTWSVSTETLTVWRKLYVELDCMANVNFEEGPQNRWSVRDDEVNEVDGSVIKTDIVTVIGVRDQFGFFNPGEQDHGVARCYDWDWSRVYLGNRDITANTNDINGKTDFTLSAAPPANTDWVYVYDDDVDPTNLAANQNDPPTPIAKIQPSLVSTATIAAPECLPAACIEAVPLEDDTNIPFHLNVDDAAALDQILSNARDVAGSEMYWRVECLGAYQYGDCRSRDEWSAQVRSNILGLADSFWSALGGTSTVGDCTVFFEAVREVSGQPASEAGKVAAHELAHLFGSVHGDGGIMDGGSGYSAKTLRRLMLIHKGGPSQSP